jgi:hypothetical protein
MPERQNVFHCFVQVRRQGQASGFSQAGDKWRSGGRGGARTTLLALGSV